MEKIQTLMLFLQLGLVWKLGHNDLDRGGGGGGGGGGSSYVEFYDPLRTKRFTNLKF